MADERAKLEVSVWRGDASGGRLETFEVPAYGNQTILDAVSWIQQNADPTLAYRFACRVGMCGSCAMTVNGKPRWTCRTQVNKVLDGNRIKVEPLRNLPVVKDLATDMEPFFEKWLKAEGRHHPTAGRNDAMPAVKPDSPERIEASKGIECINCGVCHAACDTVAGNPDYLGPAALQRAWTLYNDVRDGGKQAIIDAVSGSGGCHSCHSQGSCSLHCPVGLDPMAAVAGLKRESVRALFRGVN